MSKTEKVISEEETGLRPLPPSNCSDHTLRRAFLISKKGPEGSILGALASRLGHYRGAGLPTRGFRLHWAPEPGEPVRGPTAPRAKLPHRLSITQQTLAQTGPSRLSRALWSPDRAEGTRGAFRSCPMTCRGAPEPAARWPAAGSGRRGGLGAVTWGLSSVSEIASATSLAGAVTPRLQDEPHTGLLGKIFLFFNVGNK